VKIYYSAKRPKKVTWIGLNYLVVVVGVLTTISTVSVSLPTFCDNFDKCGQKAEIMTHK